MNIGWLETFVAVAQAGSFSQAAREGYATPSTLMQQVSSLEKQLGFLLLKRGHRGVTLTPAGDVYLRWAQELLSIERRAREDAQAVAGLTQPAIRFGTYHNIELMLLKEVFATFEPHCASTRLEFIGGDHRSFYQRLLDDELDVYVYPWGDELDRHDIGFQQLGTTELSCVVAYGHPLASLDRIEPQRLANSDVIVGCGSASLALQGVAEELAVLAPGVRMHEVATEEEMWQRVVGDGYVLLNMDYSSRYLGGGISVSLTWPRNFRYGLVFRTPCTIAVQELLKHVRSCWPSA